MNQESSKELPLLVRRAKNGNKEAFRNIFDLLNNKMLAFVHPRIPSRDDAMDVVQETFIELWNSLEKFKYRSENEFYGFVFTIAKRKLYKYYKTRKATLPLHDEVLSDGYEMQTEDYRYLLGHISSLSSDYQDLLKLRYWSDMKFADIASILNIKESTAKVWHHRAMKQLQNLLKNYETA